MVLGLLSRPGSMVLFWDMVLFGSIWFYWVLWSYGSILSLGSIRFYLVLFGSINNWFYLVL